MGKERGPPRHFPYDSRMGNDTGAQNRQPATRREKFIRALYAVGGIIGTAAAGLVVAVAAPLIVDWIKGDAGAPIADRPGCDEGGMLAGVGEQNIDVSLSEQGENCWQTSLDGIGPGDQFDVLIRYRNSSGEQVDDVMVKMQLPDDGDIELVANSSKVGNSNHPEGADAQFDGIATDGMNIGSYATGGNAWVIATLRLTEDAGISCGLDSRPIYARLPNAQESDTGWVGAVLVSSRYCSP